MKNLPEELKAALASQAKSTLDMALELGLSAKNAASCGMHHVVHLTLFKQRNPKADLDAEFKDIQHLKISELKLVQGDFLKTLSPKPYLEPHAAMAATASGEKKR